MQKQVLPISATLMSTDHNLPVNINFPLMSFTG